jgi:hypothetical protein
MTTHPAVDRAASHSRRHERSLWLKFIEQFHRPEVASRFSSQADIALVSRFGSSPCLDQPPYELPNR